MKYILALALILAFSQTANADTLLRLKNGKVDIWTNIYEKGKQYCTQKNYGLELCEDKANIAKLEKVADGTDPLEYGSADTAGLQAQSNNLLAAQEEKEEKAKKERDAVYDRARTKQKREDEREYGKDKANRLDNTVEGRSSTMERSGNSIR